MALYYTKETLYKEIDNLRKSIGIRERHYPLDPIDMCERSPKYVIDSKPFFTKGLQGVLFVDDDMKYILLNSCKSRSEQNFFCMHEVIHGYLHTGLGIESFNCYDQVRPYQNQYYEWHANEGAAEFLVPYRLFIPRILQCFNPDHPEPIMFGVRELLADEFGVSERVIYNRIESLKYEIMQAHMGIPIENIRLLSSAQQNRMGLSVQSLNELGAIEDFSVQILG